MAASDEVMRFGAHPQSESKTQTREIKTCQLFPFVYAHFARHAQTTHGRLHMARRGRSLRVVLALALLAVLVSAQDTGCAADGVCYVDASDPVETVDSTTIEAKGSVYDASEPSASEQVPSTPDTTAPEALTDETSSDKQAESTTEEDSVEDHSTETHPKAEVTLETPLTENENVNENSSRETCASPTDDTNDNPMDPWFPPWVHRRVGQVKSGVRDGKVKAVSLFRSALRSLGLLENFDALVLQISQSTSPYLHRYIFDNHKYATEKFHKATENIVKLYTETRKSMKRRHEHKLKLLEKEREEKIANGEDVETEIKFSQNYWRRQVERSNVLFGDFQNLVGMGYGEVKGKAVAVTDSVKKSYSSAKVHMNRRLVPFVSRVRVALGKKAKPIVDELLTKYPEQTVTASIKAAKVMSVLGIQTYKLDESLITDLSMSKLSESSRSNNAKVTDEAAALLGDLFGLLVLLLGTTSVSYFVIFRTRPGDSIPDEFSFKVKHVPANDGTFIGNAVGGGMDVLITLPDVKKAAECEILVSEELIKVKALDGFHDVTIHIPPEAKGNGWKQNVDAWIMKARFDSKQEVLTICLRTPASAMSRSVNSPLGGENVGNWESVQTPSRVPFAPVSPITPVNKSLAADKAKEAVRLATSGKKKPVGGRGEE